MDNDILKVVAVIIVDPSGKILLQRKDLGYKFGPGKWSLFGGHIERNETREEAMIREIREEIGTDIDLTNLKYFKNFIDEFMLKGNKKVDHEVFILNFDGDLSKIKLGEGAGFSLFEISELKKLDILQSNIIDKYIKQLSG